MKQAVSIIVLLAAFFGVVLNSCSSTMNTSESSGFVYAPVEFTILEDDGMIQSDSGEWSYPIAPGVYYPWEGDGELAEVEMRYYRVRCWPGCHTGSSIGMYPDDPFHDTPIFMTSKIDYPAGH